MIMPPYSYKNDEPDQFTKEQGNIKRTVPMPMAYNPPYGSWTPPQGLGSPSEWSLTSQGFFKASSSRFAGLVLVPATHPTSPGTRQDRLGGFLLPRRSPEYWRCLSAPAPIRPGGSRCGPAAGHLTYPRHFVEQVFGFHDSVLRGGELGVLADV